MGEVTLKAYLQLQIKHERELREQAERYIAKDLVKQAKEYERRLEILNHAHEQAVDIQHTYVTDEKFDALLETISKKNKEDDKRFGRIESYQNKLLGIVAFVTVILPIIVYILTRHSIPTGG
jgi:uncharacterized protein YbaP (TraB family)